jgi:hypothetical protein
MFIEPVLSGHRNHSADHKTQTKISRRSGSRSGLGCEKQEKDDEVFHNHKGYGRVIMESSVFPVGRRVRYFNAYMGGILAGRPAELGVRLFSDEPADESENRADHETSGDGNIEP